MSANIFLIVIGILLLCKIVDGYKKGMVREIVSFISLILLCVVVALVGNGLKSYLSGNIFNVIVTVVLLAILCLAHHILNVILFPAKLITKLPVVHGFDKLLGAMVGVLETILVLWTVYTFVMMMDLGITGVFIRECIAENPILTWFYEHNQLAGWVEKFGAEFMEQLPFL